MKNLILFGSARNKNGHTKQMLDLFLDNLGGENYIVDAYNVFNSEKPIMPCKDCRYCWKIKGCSIDDMMTEVYQKLEESDNLIVASSVYFASVPGPLKLIIDRFQPYFASYLRKDKPEKPLRKGALLMVGGAPYEEKQFLGTQLVANNLFNDTDTEIIGDVFLSNSDHDSLDTKKDVYNSVISLSEKMKGANNGK